MTKLADMKNIGKTLADRMEFASIKSSEDLVELGAKKAFIKIISVYPEACINHLYAIEGAIQDIRWHHLPDKVKADLKDFYNSL